MKVFVAIDVQNLWYTSKEAFGQGYRINFQKLRRVISDNVLSTTTEVDKPVIEAIAYVIIGQDHDNTSFLEMLERLHYKVRRRYMRWEKSGHLDAEGEFHKNPYKSDWDVGITIDTLIRCMEGGVGRFVLVSGDGDYCPLLEELRRRDVECDVYTFETSGSRALRTTANRAYTLDGGVLFNTRHR